jgi:hypothetical protein
LSERRFFAEFLDSPEPEPSLIFPSEQTPDAFAARLLDLARPRLGYLASQTDSWWRQRIPSSTLNGKGSGYSGGACCIGLTIGHN